MPMPFASRFNSRLFGTTGLCEIAVFWPRLVDDLVKFRDDRLPFFLYAGSWSSDIQLTGFIVSP